MEESKGFLDDTSLSKTPKSPLKTSTVLRPTSKRSENLFSKRLAACAMDGSFNPGGEASFQALSEITNIPHLPLLKQRLKSVSEMGDDVNSSLGILDNISDATDLSLQASGFIKNLRNIEEPKQSENNSIDSLMVEESPSINVQNVEEHNEESDRNSSPDLVYDGTNIPELNLDYDPLSVFYVPTSSNFTTAAWTSNHLSSTSKIHKENEESFFKDFEAIKNDSDTYNSTRKSLQSSNAEASNEESKMTRDSLFETFNPAYDSIFKTLMPNASVSDDDKVSKLTQAMNTCSFVDGNSSELQAILQNQSLAEKNFLKNLQRLNEDLKDNCISFRINEMKIQNCAAQCKVLSPKTILCRLSNSNNKESGSPVEIPILFEAGSENCDLNFTLTATLQTTSFSEPIGFLRISASVGRAELVPIDTTQKRLLLYSEAGSVCNQNVTVKNQCSFPVVYDLLVVEDDSNSFSVSPTTLNLQPSQKFAVTISFSPTSTLVVKGNLQAAAQPHGKVFDLIELIGSSKSAGFVSSASRNAPSNVVSKVSSKDIKKMPYNSSNIIESDKKYLSWGGVDIGSTVIKTFNIRNCTNKSLQAKFFIKEKSQSSFKIIDANNVHTTNFILEFAAKEQKSISVAFTPTQIAPSSGFLAIKPIMTIDQKIFSMPLAGYGGTGKLKIAEVYEKEGIGHCLDIIMSREQKTFFNNLNVRNIGLRPVFVKVVVSSANSFKENVVINPSEFILFENDSKSLIVSCSIENFSSLNAADFGFITLLYGDEIIRQQLRRSVGENSTKPRTLYHGINFDVPFVGEERVPYDSTYVSKINISSLFSASIKKQVIHLNIIEKEANCTQMTFDALSVLDNTFSSTMANSTLFRRVTAGAGSTYSPPVKDFTVDTLNRLSMPNSPIFYPNPCSLFTQKMDENIVEKEGSSGFWTVKPEILTIDSANKDNRILLINLSKQDMKFKIESPIDVISVSPVSGIISAGGQIGLRICIIPYTLNKLCDDYKGYIKVICDGSEKSVLINVHKEQKKNKDSLNISESNIGIEQLPDAPLEASIANKTLVNSTSISIKSLCEFPKEIILSATAPGKISETTLVVQNPEKSSVEWAIRPFSMLFTQSLEDSLNASSVLQVLPSSGCLQSKEKTNIVIKFMPSNPDCFYRFFELSLSFSNGVKQKCNFKISGSSFLLAENPELNKSSAVTRFSKKKSRTDIYIENENIEFTITSLGENSTAYVIAKNPSIRDYKLNITKPRMPFMVQQSSVLVRSKKFLKIPVIFRPTKRYEMDCEDILLLRSEAGHEFMIKLKGVCN